MIRLLEVLHFASKHASKDAEKILRSAVSNLLNKDEETRVEPSDLYVKEAYVDQGPTIKRISPAPMGTSIQNQKKIISFNSCCCK